MDSNVGLAIQCVGVLLITLLSIFMRSSIKSNALNYWTASWAGLSLSLISLFVGFQLDSQQSLLYSGYFFGEYVFGLLFIAALAWFIWDGLKAREAAVAASRAACAAEQAMFLDDTVAVRSLRPVRTEGSLKLRRVYSFEYSVTGNDRHNGSIVLIGDQVIVLNLEPRRAQWYPPLH